ncbi:MAG: ThiF family adenylyltransferase [Campylobacterales bacterium]|nr:ThiF family adenylyltransferase [Campylobacterales bacterium]
MDRFDRSRKLFRDDFEKIQNAKVLLLGVGGVGSYCLDCLYRTGFRDITIVDFDTYEISNQNRQIGSEHIGEKKVEVLSKLYDGVKPIYQKIDEAWLKTVDFKEYDVVLDAIDDIVAKVHVAKRAHKKLISSMGSAKKQDPSQIKVDKIWNTEQDSFAKVVKNQLKLHKFKESYTVVYSTESAKDIEELGSFVGVTGSFGMTLCAEAIKKIQRKP